MRNVFTANPIQGERNETKSNINGKEFESFLKKR